MKLRVSICYKLCCGIPRTRGRSLDAGYPWRGRSAGGGVARGHVGLEPVRERRRQDVEVPAGAVAAELAELETVGVARGLAELVAGDLGAVTVDHAGEDLLHVGQAALARVDVDQTDDGRDLRRQPGEADADGLVVALALTREVVASVGDGTVGTGLLAVVDQLEHATAGVDRGGGQVHVDGAGLPATGQGDLVERGRTGAGRGVGLGQADGRLVERKLLAGHLDVGHDCITLSLCLWRNASGLNDQLYYFI